MPGPRPSFGARRHHGERGRQRSTKSSARPHGDLPGLAGGHDRPAGCHDHGPVVFSQGPRRCRIAMPAMRRAVPSPARRTCRRVFVAGCADKRSVPPDADRRQSGAPTHDADRGLCVDGPAGRRGHVVPPTMTSIKELHGADACESCARSCCFGAVISPFQVCTDPTTWHARSNRSSLTTACDPVPTSPDNPSAGRARGSQYSEGRRAIALAAS